MAPSVPQNFCASTDYTPIQLVFLPSAAQTPAPTLIIDSRAVVVGRNTLQMTYLMTVTFGVDTQEFSITENIKSTAKAGSGVIGTARVPFADLKEPIFEYRRDRGNYIKITLQLKQATDFRMNHYSAIVSGKWKEGTKNILQLRQLGELATKVKAIEINLPNAPMVPNQIRTHILGIFSQCTTSQRALTQANMKLGPFLRKTTAASPLKTTEEDIETVEISGKAQLKGKAGQVRKRGQEEEVTGPRSEKQELRKIKIAEQQSSELFETQKIPSTWRSIVGKPLTTPPEFTTTTTEYERLEETQESDESERMKEDQYITDAASMLQHDYTNAEEKYHLCQKKLEILLKAIGALREQKPSEELLDQILDEQAILTSSSISRGRTLFVGTTEPEAKMLSVIDREDLVWIMSVVPLVSNDNQEGFKIDFVSHGTAAVALRHARDLISEKYDDWQKRPTVDYFRGPPIANAKRLSTNVDRAKISDPPIYPCALDEGMILSCEEKQKLQLQIQELKENCNARSEHISILQNEIKSLKKQLNAHTDLSQKATRTPESFDLLALDIEQEIGEESTLVRDITKAHRQPSWLELELDMPGSFPAIDKRPVQSAAANDQAMPGVKPTAFSQRLKSDTILKIDDAVDTMAHVQKNALKSGKAVTVELREPGEMIDWLAQRNQSIPSNHAESRRTLAMLWL